VGTAAEPKTVKPLVGEQLARLPQRPGVYLMRDAAGQILYVGKAAVLRHRVRSYFQNLARLTPKLRNMVARVADIDFYVAASEAQALVMELNFIKQYHPPYNVRLRDDKTFPYLKVDVADDWPRVYATRRFQDDGGRYFGPFASAGSVKQTLKTLRGIFPLRTCTSFGHRRGQPCLEYHLGHCLAPCSGAVGREEYRRVVDEVILFLEGKSERVVRELKSQMSQAARDTDYERAARLRDQIAAIEDVIEGERISAVIRGEQDVIAFAGEGDRAFAQVLFVRGNKLTGREGFLLQGVSHEPPRRVMTSFVQQFYSSSPQIPPRLLLQHPVDDKELLREWLRERRGGAVAIEVPRRGAKKQLVDIAAENARQGLERVRIKELAAPKSLTAALKEIEKELNLPAPPERMEAYDISNIQGTSAVGSLVVFEGGRPKPAHYRRFKIRTVEGADDYAMLREVLRRRFKRAEGKAGGAWAIAPDLVLIDGGKGQLNAARAVLQEIENPAPLASLAKENEEIFLPGRKDPVVLPRSSPGLQLLQRLRDEAHRFAIGYFTSVHRRQTFASVLDAIPGIGPRRKSALLRQFGSVSRIREASVEELAAAAGMSRDQASRVKEQL